MRPGTTDCRSPRSVAHIAALTAPALLLFTVEELDVYILTPRDPIDLASLVGAVRPNPRKTDIDVVIGFRGPNAPPELCNGLMLPIVRFDQLYRVIRFNM